MDKPLQTTLGDAVRLLQQHQIPYALIGGLAASLQGEPRVTADIDIVIATGVEDALGLLSATRVSSFEPLFPGVEEVVRQAFILPLRHRSTGVKVDLSIGMSGFEQQLITRAQATEVASQSLQLATAEDMLVMKVLAGRPRDQQDAIGIAMVQNKSLDWNYCLKTATELGEAIDQDLVKQIEKLRELIQQ